MLTMEDLEEASYKDYEAGSYSPPRITESDKLIELQVSGRGNSCLSPLPPSLLTRNALYNLY